MVTLRIVPPAHSHAWSCQTYEEPETFLGFRYAFFMRCHGKPMRRVRVVTEQVCSCGKEGAIFHISSHLECVTCDATMLTYCYPSEYSQYPESETVVRRGFEK